MFDWNPDKDSYGVRENHYSSLTTNEFFVQLFIYLHPNEETLDTYITHQAIFLCDNQTNHLNTNRFFIIPLWCLHDPINILWTQILLLFHDMLLLRNKNERDIEDCGTKVDVKTKCHVQILDHGFKFQLPEPYLQNLNF